MKLIYEEHCKFNPTIKEVLKRNNINSVSLIHPDSEDFLLIDGMRHFITLTKKRKISLKNYIFIDSGYFGNFGRGISYLRLIPNSLHPKNLNTPMGDIEKFLFEYDSTFESNYLKILNEKKNILNFNTALIIPPSRKYCRVDEIKVENWINAVEDNLIKKNFKDSYIRIKDSSRAERMVYNPIWNDISNKRALICHSSLTSIDAALYGIPFIDLGDGPLVHLSYSIKEIKKGKVLDNNIILENFNKLLFYQCLIKDFEKKLFEIMDFYKSS